MNMKVTIHGILCAAIVFCASQRLGAQELDFRDVENGEQPGRLVHLVSPGNRLVNNPTAYTLERASYAFNCFVHDEGGMEIKSYVGVHDNLYFGVSFNIDHFLGAEVMRPSIPGVVAKIKLVDGFYYVPAIAVGYDSFYQGKHPVVDDARSFKQKVRNGPYFVFINPLVYVYRKNVRKDLYYNQYFGIHQGPYIAFTNPIYLFKSEQFIVYGVRMPVQPDFLPRDTSYFFGLDIPLGKYFRIKAELDRVFWDLRRPGEWIINFGARVTFFDQLGLELGLLYEPGEQLNRVLRIEYNGMF